MALAFAAALAMREADLVRLRAAAATYAAFGVLQAGALLRFPNDVRWAASATWVYVTLLVSITATGLYAWRAANAPAVDTAGAVATTPEG